MTDLATPASPAAESQIVDENRPAPAPSPWAWMVGACLLLIGSGAVRLWQETRYEAAFENAQTPLFSLKDLPRELGDWVAMGEDEVISQDTLTIAGSTDYVARQYVNETTGVALQALVVFGPAERVFAHSPAVCFPAIGYGLAEQDGPRTIPLAPAGDGSDKPASTAQFASAVYARNSGAAVAERVESMWSFWHDGIWSADASQTRKLFRHHPEMFKVQVQRMVAPGEKRGENNPSVEFLAQFLPEIQARIDASRAATADQKGREAAAR